MVIDTERLAAIWTFARSRRNTFLDTFLAENVTAGFDGGVFEVLSADGADSNRLRTHVSR